MLGSNPKGFVKFQFLADASLLLGYHCPHMHLPLLLTNSFSVTQQRLVKNLRFYYPADENIYIRTYLLNCSIEL